MQAHQLQPGDNFHTPFHGYCICIPLHLVISGSTTPTHAIGAVTAANTRLLVEGHLPVCKLPAGTVEVAIPTAEEPGRKIIASVRADLCSVRPRHTPPASGPDVVTMLNRRYESEQTQR